MTGPTPDADLVARHLAGDRSAFAAIYDRYGERLYDTAAAMTGRRHDAADIVQDVFVTAAERLGQLRDPSKLKPWLFAILRNEVYRRGRSERRTISTDFSDPVADMAAPTDPAADGSLAEYEELASLVRTAAAGLDARDQLVLELSLRQGLDGDDLAAALGVSAQQSYGLVHRMRQRTERSLGAYCVARAGRRDCPRLDELLADWDGEFSVLIRKRVARHVDGCATCERSRTKLAPFPLFGAAPVLAAPSDLRDRVLGAIGTPRPAPPYSFEAPGGFPSVLRHGRRIATWFSAVTIALLLVGAGAVLSLPDRQEFVAVGDLGAVTDPSTGPGASDGSAVPSRAASPTAATTAVDAMTPTSTITTDTITTDTTTTDTTTTNTSTTTTTRGITTSTTTGSTASGALAPTPTTTGTSPAPGTTSTTTSSTTSSTDPGALALSAGTVDFGTSTNQITLVLSNPGGVAVSWSTGPVVPAGTSTMAVPGSVGSPFGVSPRSGSLAPGASVEVTLTLDRRWPVEGPLPEARITFAAPGTAADVVLRATIARPPVVRLLARPPATTCVWNGQAFSWQVAIDDESFPIDAVVDIVPPGGGRVVVPLQRDGDWFGWTTGNHDGDPNGLVDLGVHSWTVVAKDAFGNRTTIGGSTTVVEGTQNC